MAAAFPHSPAPPCVRAFRRTKIVCTIGPASRSAEVLAEMIRAGMDVARLNFSHGTPDEHRQTIRVIREEAQRAGKPVAILQDLCGPKMRIGEMDPPEVRLEAGQPFLITTREAVGNAQQASVLLESLPRALRPGNRLFLNDGIIELRVERVEDPDVFCRVEVGGILSARKGLNIPDVSVDVAAVTEKDLQDLDLGIEEGVDWVAASFVRTAEDLKPLRERMAARGVQIPILAKIEKHEAVGNLEAILDVADGAMVARGDLGIEVSLDEVPLLQKNIIAQCNRRGKPVVTATEMLDSMFDRPRPTRAEVADVANAIFDGTDCVMLSRETATGRYPVEAVRMMHRIAASTEGSPRYQRFPRQRRTLVARTVTDSIGEAVRAMVHDLPATAVITATTSGYTARMVAKHRPTVPIVAVSPHVETVRRLMLSWGVWPLYGPLAETTDEALAGAVATALGAGAVKEGDLVVLTAGVPLHTPGCTNLIKVQEIGGTR
ncbi:MAG: pyruvate kinase [Armatimonadota bacterium]|nr:pyruvate kinase [Armatimonadota bacterium]